VSAGPEREVIDMECVFLKWTDIFVYPMTWVVHIFALISVTFSHASLYTIFF